MKVIIKIFNTLFLIAFLLNIQSAKAQEKIQIGLLVPLSGEHSEIGKSIIQSVIMGINKIDNDIISIVPGDTKSNPEEALRVVENLYKLKCLDLNHYQSLIQLILIILLYLLKSY